MNRINYHVIFFSAVLVVWSASVSLRSFGQPSQARRKVDKSTVLFQFQHQLFKSLNSKLEEYQSAYDQEYREEDNVFNAYDVFSTTDTAFESLFSAWRRECSDCYAPLVARAKYYCACARQARGRKWTIEKGQKEYQEMEHFYSLALNDIFEALKNHKQLDVCYAMVVEIGGVISHEEVKRKALADALNHHPYAYRIRLKYVQTLTPRLGGSYDQMKAFIDSCSPLAAVNPRLKELAASIPADKGSVCSFTGKYREAVALYTEALAYSKDPSYFSDRGDAYFQLRDYTHAINDYDHALELSPNDPDLLSRKSNAAAFHTRISQQRTANPYPERRSGQNENDQAQSLIAEKNRINDHFAKGNNFSNSGRYEEAITEFSKVIQMAPYEYLPYYSRAGCYAMLHEDDNALQDLLRVVELKPDYINAYPRLTLLYANRGMYDNALTNANKWISLDPSNGEAFFNRGKINERLGSNIEAVNDMQQACDLGYDKACHYYKQMR